MFSSIVPQVWLHHQIDTFGLYVCYQGVSNHGGRAARCCCPKFLSTQLLKLFATCLLRWQKNTAGRWGSVQEQGEILGVMLVREKFRLRETLHPQRMSPLPNYIKTGSKSTSPGWTHLSLSTLANTNGKGCYGKTPKNKRCT